MINHNLVVVDHHNLIQGLERDSSLGRQLSSI